MNRDLVQTAPSSSKRLLKLYCFSSQIFNSVLADSEIWRAEDKSDIKQRSQLPFRLKHGNWTAGQMFNIVMIDQSYAVCQTETANGR